MRAKEFITEDSIFNNGSIQDNVARSLPSTYVIPALQNQNAYMQYRFGVALAGAKGSAERKAEGDPNFTPTTNWGENEIIISSDPEIGKWIDMALKDMGLPSSDKKLVSTKTSDEPLGTITKSPVVAFKGYKRK
jgi:hypothetical protein